eukprot:m.1298394 g.1298394  ORF g.1298394 m.1298394 type:complete len:85 (-) comp24798_c1_seq73:1832-2086(-)
MRLARLLHAFVSAMHVRIDHATDVRLKISAVFGHHGPVGPVAKVPHATTRHVLRAPTMYFYFDAPAYHARVSICSSAHQRSPQP